MAEVVRSAARVLEIFEFFASSEERLTLAEVAAKFGLPKSSAYVLLQTLCAKFYLSKDANGRYSLGLSSVCAGQVYRAVRGTSSFDISMLSLMNTIQETVLLSSYSNTGSLILLKQAAAPLPVRCEVGPNYSYYALSTALGMSMFGAYSASERQQLVGQFDSDISILTTAHESWFEIVRQSGHCIMENDLDQGCTSVAIGLTGIGDRYPIALGVACVSTRFEEKKQQILDALTTHAQALRGKPFDWHHLSSNERKALSKAHTHHRA